MTSSRPRASRSASTTSSRPSLDEQVDDGTQITVQFARPFELSVDGESKTHWVTATDVADALGEIGQRFLDADLSASRGGSIDRDGMTPRRGHPQDARGQARRARSRSSATLTALTVEDALEELGVKVDKHDIVSPASTHELEDGDKLVFTDIRIVTKHVNGEALDFGTVEREDSSMYEGETAVVRAGDDGVRDVTYRIVYRNGELVATKVVSQNVLRDAGRRDRQRRHQGAGPRPTSPPATPSGTSSRSASPAATGPSTPATATTAACSSPSAPGRRTAAPGCPHQRAARPRSRSPTKVRDASGGYGAWPACRSARPAAVGKSPLAPTGSGHADRPTADATV